MRRAKDCWRPFYFAGIDGLSMNSIAVLGSSGNQISRQLAAEPTLSPTRMALSKALARSASVHAFDSALVEVHAAFTPCREILDSLEDPVRTPMFARVPLEVVGDAPERKSAVDAGRLVAIMSSQVFPRPTMRQPPTS